MWHWYEINIIQIWADQLGQISSDFEIVHVKSLYSDQTIYILREVAYLFAKNINESLQQDH
jgi:hypothetical protein